MISKVSLTQFEEAREKLEHDLSAPSPPLTLPFRGAGAADGAVGGGEGGEETGVALTSNITRQMSVVLALLRARLIHSRPSGKLEVVKK